MKKTAALAGISAAALGVALLTGCGTEAQQNGPPAAMAGGP